MTIKGSVAPADLDAARAFVNTGEDWDRFHPLCNRGPSLCGLGDWVAEHIQAVGNLSERDYSVEEVAKVLRDMVKVVPSLTLKVHCGGEYETTTCVATVTVSEGFVTVGPPEVATVGDGMAEQGAARLMQLITRRATP